MGRWRGSSPLTRGKRFPFTLDDGTRRLIPAHAGKTEAMPKLPGDRRAHPRSRGENETDAGIEIEARGSSPLTRGKHGKLDDTKHTLGLIPAHAGKTRSA